jgi:hypothetical protein
MDDEFIAAINTTADLSFDASVPTNITPMRAKRQSTISQATRLRALLFSIF